MLITLSKKVKDKEIELLKQKLSAHGIHHRVSDGCQNRVVGLEKSPSQELIEELKGLAGVESIMSIKTPYKMTSSSYKPQRTEIVVDDVVIGGDKVVLMAGPCAIESEEQMRAIALELKGMGVSVLRGSAYKPRSSPYSFQGMGLEGLRIHKRLKKEHGLVIETEVMDIRDVEVVAEHVDIVRIGARNMQNFDLLKEVGGCGRPVILKRGISATVEEWLLSAEYLMTHGNSQVILCERGIRTFETATRSTLDLSSVAVVKTISHLPVIVDPSHAAGRKDIIPDLSKAAVAVGVDGLLIEVHHLPEGALCDGKQALLPSDLRALQGDMEKIARAMGRSM
jgi:3-deoxy-7-phosphoheptulonate synthase